MPFGPWMLVLYFASLYVRNKRLSVRGCESCAWRPCMLEIKKTMDVSLALSVASLYVRVKNLSVRGC